MKIINLNVFSFLPYSSIGKTGHSFACAKAVLLFRKIFFEYKESRQFSFAQYFSNWTNTSKLRKRNFFYRNTVSVPNHCGFGLLEVIVALGIWVFLAAAGIAMTTGSLRINTQSTDDDQAVLLASEGLDAARAMKKIGWAMPFLATNCTTGCGVATSAGTWGYSGTNNVIGKYTRQILITPVNRDGTGNIVASGGTLDPDTYKVVSKVTWNRTPVVTGLVSLFSYLTNYVKNVLTGGLIIYGDGTTTPKYRTYDRTANTFSGQLSSIVGASGVSFDMRTSPTKGEVVAGYVTAAGVLQVMCFDGTTWTNDWSVTVGGTGTTRRFDIAYETNSGDAIVLYSTNTATTNELAYRTKLGSSGCGSANWSAATNLDPVRTTGVVQWVKMASDVRASSNLITAIWADANSDLSAMVWSGTAWGNEPSAATETSLEVVSAAQDVDDFAVTYESVSGDVMVVWANSAGADGTNGVRYRVCTGGTSACTWGAVTTPPTFADDATNLDISSNPNSDEIVFASIGNAGSDLQIGYWSGSTWTDTANVDTSCATPIAGSKIVATGWLISGATTRSVVVYDDSGATNIGWYVGTTSTFALQGDFTTAPVFNATQRWYDIQNDPVSKDQLMFTISSSTGSLFAKRLIMTSVPGFTWSNSDGGTTALVTTLPQLINNPFAFAYWKK